MDAVIRRPVTPASALFRDLDRKYAKGNDNDSRQVERTQNLAQKQGCNRYSEERREKVKRRSTDGSNSIHQKKPDECRR